MLRQCNYEIEVEAAGKNAAIVKAIAELEEEATEGEFVDFDGAEVNPDYDFNEESGEMSGIHIEEVQDGN